MRLTSMIGITWKGGNRGSVMDLILIVSGHASTHGAMKNWVQRSKLGNLRQTEMVCASNEWRNFGRMARVRTKGMCCMTKWSFHAKDCWSTRIWVGVNRAVQRGDVLMSGKDYGTITNALSNLIEFVPFFERPLTMESTKGGSQTNRVEKRYCNSFVCVVLCWTK